MKYTCGHNENTMKVVRDEMSYFRSRAAKEIADIDFPPSFKRKKK